MIVPRSTPRGTRVEGYFTTEFWKAYVNAYMLGANEKPLGNIRAIFSEAICSALQARLGSGALETVVFFSENLSNRVLAINIGSRSGEQEIIINARFKVDRKFWRIRLWRNLFMPGSGLKTWILRRKAVSSLTTSGLMR